MYKGTTANVAIFAWDGAAGAAKSNYTTGITVRLSLDGATGIAPASTLLQPSTVSMKGIYIQPMSSSETNCELLVVSPNTTDADIVFRPSVFYTESRTGYGISTAAVDSIWAKVVEGTSDTALHYLRGFAAALMGISTGGGSTTIKFRDVGNAKDRITAQCTTQGNRSAVALDLT
jgi:hypothetical protein